MTLTKVIGAQEKVTISQSGSANKYVLNWPKTPPAKITPKIAHSALPGDPIAVTSVTNHSIFIKWPWVKLLELKRGFLHFKVAPRPQKWLGLDKNTPGHNHPQNSTFGSVKVSESCQIGNQPLYFYLMTLNIVIRAQEEVPTSQSGSATTNTAWIGQKHAQPKPPPNSTFCTARGSSSCYIGYQPL